MMKMELDNAVKNLPNGSENPEIMSERKMEKSHNLGNKLLLLLPIGAFLTPALFVVAAYLYAEYRGTLVLPKSRKVPFISDIGDSTPQNSIFVFGLVLSSYFTLAVVIVRFFQTKYFIPKIGSCINSLGLILGILIVLGKLSVASFQLSEHFVCHFVGAGIYVACSVSYVILQFAVFLKDETLAETHRRVLAFMRGFLLIGIISGMVVFGVFLLPSLVKYNQRNYSVAQSGEWCFAACKLLFMLTFVVEFRNLRPEFQLSLRRIDIDSADIPMV